MAETASWSKLFDEDSQLHYYVNDATGESVWDEPPGFIDTQDADAAAAAAAAAEADGTAAEVESEQEQQSQQQSERVAAVSAWVMDTTEEGQVYYFNTETSESSWERPDDFVDVDYDASNVATSDGGGDATTEEEAASSAGAGGEEAEKASDTKALEPLEDPNNWQALADEDSGGVYYYNHVTEDTQWEEPACMSAASASGEADGRRGGGGKEGDDASSESKSSLSSSSSTSSRRVSFSSSSTGEINSPTRRRSSLSSLAAEGRASFSGSLAMQSMQAGGGEGESIRLSSAASIFGASSDGNGGGEGENEDGGGGGGGGGADGDDEDEDEEGQSESKKDLQQDQQQQEGGKPTVDVAGMNPTASVEEITTILEGVTFEQFAHKHFRVERRASMFQMANKGAQDRALTWKPDMIKTPLSAAMPSAELSAAAIKLFGSVLGCMGDRETNKSQAEHVTKIVSQMLSGAAPDKLRDELFCQICRQTRGNPSSESMIRGLQLMLVCLATFAPSDYFAPHLMAHCLSLLVSPRQQQTASHTTATAAATATTTTIPDASSSSSKSNSSEIYRLTEAVLRACIKAVSLPPRLVAPTEAEMEKIIKCESQEVEVFFLDSKSIIVSYDHWTTISGLETQVASQLGMHKTNAKCFALYEEGGVAGKGLRVLNGDERVQDLLSLWQLIIAEEEKANSSSSSSSSSGGRRKPPAATPAVSSFSLLYKIRYFLDATGKGTTVADADPVAVKLFYMQAIHDVIEARYPCSEQEAMLLAGLQAQEMLGDINLDKEDDVRDSQAFLKGTSLAHFFPRQHIGGPLDEKKKSAMLAGMKRCYLKTQGLSQAAAQLAYLAIVRSWKTYGASYFFAEAQNNLDFPAEIVLAVTCRSVLVLDPISATYLVEYPLSNVVSWGNSFNSFALVLGTKTSQEKVYFKTIHAQEITDIIKTLLARSS